MKKILWLASWYPTRINPLTGDFIERHARAVSLYHKITVLYVIKDNSERKDPFRKEVRNYNENLTAIILYYRAGSRFVSAVRYFFSYRKLIREFICIYGKPDKVHVHVAFRAGIIALYIKLRYGIKYLISEHWSLFNDAANPSYHGKSFLFKQLLKLIYRNASGCSAVSDHLATSLESKMNIAKPVVIPNVIDPSLFFYENKNETPFKFIHVSQLNYPKNAEEILEAVLIAAGKTDRAFKLTIYGPSVKSIISLIDKKGIGKYIELKKEVPQHELAPEIRNHHAFILYSRYETFGCVIIEALASGLPVIVSDIPSMRELVEENINGSIVQLNNPQLLAQKMQDYVEGKIQFNTVLIAATASKKYSFEAVGKQFDELYKIV